MGGVATIWLTFAFAVSLLLATAHYARPSLASRNAVVIVPADADMWHDFTEDVSVDEVTAAVAVAGAALLSVLVLLGLMDERVTNLYRHHVAVTVVSAPVVAYGAAAVLNSALNIPRPDFMNRCAPAMSAPELMLFPTYTSTVGAMCNGDEDEIAEGLRGWPSCHAAAAFGVLWVVSAVSATMAHSCKIRGGWRWAALFALNATLLVAAVYCAWSRVVDNLHSESAVVAGALVGIVCAHFVLVFILPYRDVVEGPIRVERRATLFDPMTRL